MINPGNPGTSSAGGCPYAGSPAPAFFGTSGIITRTLGYVNSFLTVLSNFFFYGCKYPFDGDVQELRDLFRGFVVLYCGTDSC